MKNAPSAKAAFSIPAQESGIRTDYNERTGKLSFLGADPSNPIAIRDAQNANFSPEDRGLAIITPYASQFGLQNIQQELTTLSARQANKFEVTRYQQTYKGIRVIGGELVVNATSMGGLISIIGEISPNLSIDTVPSVSSEQAQETALKAVAKWNMMHTVQFSVSEPELWIYDPRLIAPVGDVPLLVWQLEVTSATNLVPIRELVLVDAHHGNIPLHFNQIDTGFAYKSVPQSVNSSHHDILNESEVSGSLDTRSGNILFFSGGNRRTYTANHSYSLPGSLLCNNNLTTCTNGANSDADFAHLYAGETYQLYYDKHGRISIDNNGMSIDSTVNYGSNYQNAFWDGLQMVYGDGFSVADDVVAHELTHGITEHESNLFYYYQSGAINESFSDIWGEILDQSNGEGTDTPTVKWLMGEDVPGLGAIRSMNNPPIYGDPDAITSSYYYTGSGDNGGVHINSGVNNKAAYLMVDGGTFNGKTVTALGPDKTLAIYYETQTNLLASGADYSDLYNALYQACLNLINPGVTAYTDCQEVRDATDAVAMNEQPNSNPNFNTDAPLCTGSTPVDIFTDDLESGTTNWILSRDNLYTRWQYGSPYGPFAHSGIGFLYANDYPADITDASTRLRTNFIPPNAFLYFSHAYSFESGNYDGGVLEYSINNGMSWNDAGAMIDYNGYKGLIASGWGNPLSGRSAFVGSSHGYISTRLNLSSLAGQNVNFRWRMGLDSIISGGGWWLDDVRIYTCSSTPNTTITSKPANPTIVTAATFTFSSSEAGSTFECNLDGSAYVSCVSPQSYTGLLLGTHNFSVRATNIGGHTDSTPAMYTWQIVTPVSISGNAGADGVTLSYVDGVPKTVTSDESGNYTINVQYGWSGTVTPSKTGYGFTPINRMYTNVTTHQTSQDYRAGLTAAIDVYLKAFPTPIGRYSVNPNIVTTPSYNGVANGPVQVVSTNGVPIVASERVIHYYNGVNTSFYEMMGLPAKQVDTEYWFPYYNNTSIGSQIRYSNVGTQDAKVQVYIAGQPVGELVTLSPGTMQGATFAISNGPVRVVSTNGVPIVSSLRVIFASDGIHPSSFSETMGIPLSQLDTSYWFPYYNNISINTQLRFGVP